MPLPGDRRILFYTDRLIRVYTTPTFDRWFAQIDDTLTAKRIQVRIRRLQLGNHGDWAPIGEGVAELRIHHGPGYRVVFMPRTTDIIVLLAGGDKSTQPRDIRAALSLACQLRET